jgi:dynactin complex subunit
MEQGEVSCEIAERVRRLFGQAWRAHDALRALELAMDEEGDTASQSSHESQAQEEEEGLVIRIMQLHHRIDNIQKELERLQNPLIRLLVFLFLLLFLFHILF